MTTREYESRIAELEKRNQEMAIELSETAQRNVRLYQQLDQLRRNDNVSDRNSNG